MSLKLLKKQAEAALHSLQSGKEYSSQYVLNRLDSAWESNQKDQVIGNVRSVISKIASKQGFISQKEITGIYIMV